MNQMQTVLTLMLNVEHMNGIHGTDTKNASVVMVIMMISEFAVSMHVYI